MSATSVITWTCDHCGKSVSIPGDGFDAQPDGWARSALTSRMGLEGKDACSEPCVLALLHARADELALYIYPKREVIA